MAMDEVFEALQLLRYSSAVEVIDEALKLNPAATVIEVRQYADVKRLAAEAEVEKTEAQVERAVCRHCDVAIVLGNDGVWYHGDVPSWGSRGCRSHSYDRLAGWDDKLNRKWTATPV
jgi:hypothetical protein